MKPSPINSALLSPEEVRIMYEALLAAGHEDLAGFLASKAARTEWEKRYAAAIQLADENVFSMDSSVDSAPLHPFRVTFKNPCRSLLGFFLLEKVRLIRRIGVVR